MPANMMSAPVGSSLTVSGSSIATVSAGATPGSTPTKVPPRTPHIRFIGCSATPNPAIRAFSAAILDSGAAQQGREPAGGEIDVQKLDEEEVNTEREDESDRHVPERFATAKTTRHGGE